MNEEQGRKKKPLRPITAAGLQFATARYLERHGVPTRAHLRRLLGQKVRRRAAALQVDPKEWLALVEQEIERLGSILDDAHTAAEMAGSLQRKGNSALQIRAKLAAKGLRGEQVTEAMAARSEEADPDLEAARIYARKRRLGPWRKGPADPQKEAGKMARAGFRWDVVKRVLAERLDEPEEPADDEF